MTTLDLEVDIGNEDAFHISGESLLILALEDKLINVTTLRVKGNNRQLNESAMETAGFNSFANFLAVLLRGCPSLTCLELERLRCPCMDMFSEIELHSASSKIDTLRVRFCMVTDDDIIRMGPCFPNAENLVWYLNDFNEVAYEMNVDPYFRNIHFDNDDGWWPGCELWGDGQSTQDKNSRKYYRPK